MAFCDIGPVLDPLSAPPSSLRPASSIPTGWLHVLNRLSMRHLTWVMFPRYLAVRGGPRYTVRGAGRLAPGTPLPLNNLPTSK
jgi:hypothetical protein